MRHTANGGIPAAVSSALSFNKDLALPCSNSWIARSVGVIGDVQKDFAAADASNHYRALRDMVLDVSVTALTAEGGGMYVGLSTQVYRAGAWVDVQPATGVINPFAGLVPFHSSAQIALKAGDYLRFLTNANNGGGNTYAGDRSFRISITESPSLTLVPANTVVRTPCLVSVNGGTGITLFGGTSARVLAVPPAGSVVQSATGSAGITVAVSDPKTGALEVFVTEGTKSGTVTTVTAVPAATRLLAQADSGVPVTLGTLRFQMAPSGNRSLQIASATGAPVNLRIGATWANGGSGVGVVTMTAQPGSFGYAKPAWNFTSAGDWMDVLIEDTTNSRWYSVRMEVGAGYNTNLFCGHEVFP